MAHKTHNALCSFIINTYELLSLSLTVKRMLLTVWHIFVFKISKNFTVKQAGKKRELFASSCNHFSPHSITMLWLKSQAYFVPGFVSVCSAQTIAPRLFRIRQRKELLCVHLYLCLVHVRWHVDFRASTLHLPPSLFPCNVAITGATGSPPVFACKALL